MIPIEIRRHLQPYFPEGAPWNEIVVTHQSLRGMAVYQPASLGPRPIMACTLPGAAAGLQTVGVTIGRHIYLDPNYGKLDTAAGQALLGHEVVHVNQKEKDRNFDKLYEEAAQRTDPNRPWENPYELPAYTRECQIYWGQVAKGLPPGTWKPMGVQLGLCSRP